MKEASGNPGRRTSTTAQDPLMATACVLFFVYMKVGKLLGQRKRLDTANSPPPPPPGRRYLRSLQDKKQSA